MKFSFGDTHTDTQTHLNICPSRAASSQLKIFVQVLGKDPTLTAFLETNEAPVRPAKLKKGWLSGVKDKWDARNIAAKDSDEWFGKEREWATAYSAHIK